MAKIGLKYPVYKTESGAGVISKAIQADISITVNDIKLYADDGIAEAINLSKTALLTLGIDELSDEVQALCLVMSLTAANLPLKAPMQAYVGIGFYGVKMVGGVRKYRAIWLPRVQFAEPADNNATKGETLAFATPSLEGTIITRRDGGVWKMEKTFDTESGAIAYLQDKSGVKNQCTKPGCQRSKRHIQRRNRNLNRRAEAKPLLHLERHHTVCR